MSSFQLSNVFAGLFGGSGASSGLSGFLGGAVSSSSPAAPAGKAPEWIKPTGPTATTGATPRLGGDERRAAKSAASAASGSRKRSAASASAAPEPEEEAPQKKRKSEEELRERETQTLFVGNVPLGWEKQQLRKALRRAVGDTYTGQFRPLWFRAEPLEEKWQGNLRKLGSIKKMHAKDSADAKNAYVVLASPEDVNTVRHAVHGYVADERHVLSADGVGKAAKLQTFDRKRSVFVGNLPASTSDSDLRSVFKPVGEVDAVRIVRDRVAKACKGFAFVRFKDRASVKAAINLWGAQLQ